MTNHGNTGQRYKMPKITDVTLGELPSVPGQKYLIWHLSCGHKQTRNWITWDGEFEQSRRHIGRRTRCDQCKVGKPS